MIDVLNVPDDMELAAIAVRKRPPAPPHPPAPINIGYCAERHLGLVADAKTAAAENTKRLNAWDRTDWPLYFAGKTFYFAGQIQTGLLPGCEWIGAGGGSLLGDADHGGMQTRFVRIDPDPNGAVLLVRCNGFQMRGIQLFGRVLKGNINSGSGPKTGAGLAIEGRMKPYPTAVFSFNRLGVADCDKGIHFLNGYYDDAGKFVETGDMASSGEWGQTKIQNCRVAVQSDNVNALWHTFHQLFVQRGTDELEYVFKLNAGGLIRANVHLGAWNCTLLGVGDFSPNTAYATLYVTRDGRSDPVNRLTAFEYFGKEPRDWKNFGADITLAISSERQAGTLSEFCRFNGVPSDEIWFKGYNLEHVKEPAGYKWEIVGPYRRLMPLRSEVAK
jgi:hypothetical protein